MDPSAVILCTTMLLLNGGSCHLIPQANDPQLETIASVYHQKQYKRQNPTELQLCITAKLNFAFRGNTSRFVTDCRMAAMQAIILNKSDFEDLQSNIYTTFPTFCIPECGDVVLDAYKDCGYLSVSYRAHGIEQFTAGLCGTNEDGNKCYTLYDYELIDEIESNCIDVYRGDDECPRRCSRHLIQNKAQLGCCINVYHNLIFDSEDPSPRKIYGICNVDLPGDCNNSPISGSVSHSSTVMLMLSLVCFAALG